MIRLLQLAELALNNGRLSQSTPFVSNVITDLARIILVGVFASILAIATIGFALWFLYNYLIAFGLSIGVSITIVIIPIILLLIIAIMTVRSLWVDMRLNINRMFEYQIPITDQLTNMAQSFLQGFLTKK